MSSIYNFVSQDVFVSEANASEMCVTADDKLLVVNKSSSSSSTLIKAYDLTNDCNTQSNQVIIPLHDGGKVLQMIYCESGKYIGILSVKDDVKHVRVYLNWWIGGYEMKIRPVGMLATQWTHEDHDHVISSKEMPCFELIDFKDDSSLTSALHISCCPKSGNLAICCGMNILIYRYLTLTYHHNHVARIDFTKLMQIKLESFASQVDIVENYIAFMSKQHVNLSRIVFDNDQDFDEINEKFNDEKKESHETCIHYDFSTPSIRLPSLLSIDEHIINNPKSYLHAEEVLGPASQKIACKIDLIFSKIDSKSFSRARIQILLCKYINIEDSLMDMRIHANYKFSQSRADPLDVTQLTHKDNACENININISSPLMSKNYSKSLKFGFVILTKTSCFVYRMSSSMECIQNIQTKNATKVVISQNAMHILSKDGIKTYSFNLLTSSLPVQENLHSNLGSILLNSCQFWNIEHVFNSEHYLVLVSFSDSSLRTIYSLKKPQPLNVFSDVSEVLNDFDETSKLDVMRYLYSTLYLNMLENENDESILKAYQKSIVEYCNQLFNEQSEDTNNLISCILESAKISISDLISLNSNDEINKRYIEKVLNGDLGKCEMKDAQTQLYLFKNHSNLFYKIALRSQFDMKSNENMRRLLKEEIGGEWDLIKAKLYLECGEHETAKHILVNINSDSLEHLLMERNDYINWTINNEFNNLIETTFPSIYQSCLIHSLIHQKLSIQTIFNNPSFKDVIKRRNLLKKIFLKQRMLEKELIVDLIIINITCLSEHIRDTSDYYNLALINLPKWLKQLPPFHNGTHDCACIDCNHLLVETIWLIKSISEDEVNRKLLEHLNNLSLTHFDWFLLIQLFTLALSDVIRALLPTHPTVLISYLKDLINSNEIVSVLKETLILISNQYEENTYDNQVVDYILSQLSVLINPDEFLSLVTSQWKSLAIPHMENCIKNYQKKRMRESIMNQAI